ncbi:hypothetical protein OPQ81_010667 [Rhizoctonia solani]|nr:hypothetical protein OPQ81_010667 [Rhizoctonia solani]
MVELEGSPLYHETSYAKPAGRPAVCQYFLRATTRVLSEAVAAVLPHAPKESRDLCNVPRGVTMPVAASTVPAPYVRIRRGGRSPDPVLDIIIFLSIVIGWLWYTTARHFSYPVWWPCIVPLLSVASLMAVSYFLRYHEQIRACFSHS